jgi:hypothetical protein
MLNLQPSDAVKAAMQKQQKRWLSQRATRQQQQYKLLKATGVIRKKKLPWVDQARNHLHAGLVYLGAGRLLEYLASEPAAAAAAATAAGGVGGHEAAAADAAAGAAIVGEADEDALDPDDVPQSDCKDYDDFEGRAEMLLDQGEDVLPDVESDDSDYELMAC